MVVHRASVVGHGLDWVTVEVIRLVGPSEVFDRRRHDDGVGRNAVGMLFDGLNGCMLVGW
jgi:hypothetical protein